MLTWLRFAVAMLIAAGVTAILLPQPATLSMVDRPDAEMCLVDAVAEEREEAGVGIVAADSQLMTGARSHASAMAKDAELRHSDRPATYGRHWAVLGENVAVNDSCEAMAAALKDSPSHRANTVDHRWAYVGTGAVEVDGMLWGAIAFAQPKGKLASITTVPPVATTIPAATTRPPSSPALRPPCTCPNP